VSFFTQCVELKQKVRQQLWVKWYGKGVTQLSESSQVVLSNIIIIVVVYSYSRHFGGYIIQTAGLDRVSQVCLAA
jgi:hypothetical protein